MITCLIGTRAQLIKMAPVILELERRNIPVNFVLTGQHRETMDKLIADFGIVTQPIHLYEGQEITGIVQMGKWFLRCVARAIKSSKRFFPKSPDENNFILVHGDTFSTLLGAVLGKILGINVVHIEAGLRSYNVFHPFPEELTRIVVFRLSHFSFCPGDWAYGNMQKFRSTAVNTHSNTLRDALRLMLQFPNQNAHVPNGDFGIVSIHRFENIFNRERLQEIVTLIEQAAAQIPVAFVLHPATRKKLTQFELMERLEKNPAISLVPRMGYSDFVQMMRNARFVITDGGGNQEELSYLGVPTLLMRKATERQEGLGSTVTLCNYDSNILQAFLSSLPPMENRTLALDANVKSASEIIVDVLQANRRKN